jgi:hypothetical protein
MRPATWACSHAGMWVRPWRLALHERAQEQSLEAVHASCPDRSIDRIERASSCVAAKSDGICAFSKAASSVYKRRNDAGAGVG